jgi:long-chain acyl-CoA synthetase
MNTLATLTTLFQLPYFQQNKYPQKQALAAKHIDGHFYAYSTAQVIELMNKVSLGLLQIGLKKGDKIALISYNNRPEWNIMDLAMQQIGVINVPVYPTISSKDYDYIFNDAEVKYCFVGHGDLLDKVRDAQKSVASLRGIFTFDKTKQDELDANGEAVNFWEDIFATGDLAAVEKIKESIQTNDLATIIYTSGTTGQPKGVMLTHNNIMTNLRDVYQILPLNAGEIGLSFLPLCHIFERTVTYAYMSKGISIIYPPSLDTLAESLQEFRPHFFTTVPRLLEKVYEKVMTKAKQESGLKRKIFFWAAAQTETYEYDQQLGFFNNIKWKIADKLVFSKIRARLGGRLRGIVTGAAACPRKMAQFFSAIGIPVREGYGLTETSPGIAIGKFEPYSAMLGTIGPLLSSVEVKIDSSDATYTFAPEEGEILVKGGNVMAGYYNKPDKTAEVFTSDGWFITGDIGKMVKNSKGIEFLKITDRKKELLKTSNGKYVAPTPLENRLKENFLVEQSMIVGDNHKFVSAIITPAIDPLKSWCSENNIAFTSLAETLQNPKVVAAYQAIIDKMNPDFGHVEQIKKFVLAPDAWSVETGELTPTMKLKRRVVLEKYKTEINAIYLGE